MAWHCIDCGVELPPGYRGENCPACRQLKATQQLIQAQINNQQASEPQGREYRVPSYTIDPNEPPMIIIPSPFYEQEGFWMFVIFGSILLWIMWPFITMFYRFFTG